MNGVIYDWQRSQNIGLSIRIKASMKNEMKSAKLKWWDGRIYFLTQANHVRVSEKRGAIKIEITVMITPELENQYAVNEMWDLPCYFKEIRLSNLQG